MLPTHSLIPILGVLALGSRLAHADAEALWFQPSSNWYGIDGNWSAMSLLVGEPAQEVDVTVSTTLAEIWVVEPGGCDNSALCTAARGNVFNSSASTDWDSLGLWELGLDYLDLVGNGDYGMELVQAYDSISKLKTSFQKQIVAGINETGFYTGFFGVGITPGRFGDVVEESPIAALVEADDVIPSHSYGYTAGAYYGNGGSGTPMSLTLGGYDQNRFVSHGTTFSLNSTSRLPEVLVRAITASVTSLDDAPAQWNSSTESLLSFDESVTALIDSSTPYLWLPTATCDRFASALNLTWNETFGLYLFSSDATFTSFSEPGLSFVFSLSSFDNLDNYGEPLEVAGVVNITISANAFAQTLRYPFMNLIGYGDAAIPYFPLKRAENGSQIIIGRSFLQEAYIYTDYELSTFSIYQALFPENPNQNTSIITMNAASDNPYPGNPPTSTGLSSSQIAGIAVGAALIVLSVVAIWYLRRRRNQKRAAALEQAMKDSGSSIDLEPPKTPIARILSRIVGRYPWKGRRRNVHEVSSDGTMPVEVAADQRYELAVPPEPIELDATDTHSLNDTTVLGTEDSNGLSDYELARRKLDRQLQGPVPEYSPGPSPVESNLYGSEKGLQDISSVPHYRPSPYGENQSLSPASTATADAYTFSLPSPMTPAPGEWSNRTYDFPSPSTLAPSGSFARSNSNPGSGYVPTYSYPSESTSLGRSASTSGYFSSAGSVVPPMPTIQRTPIDGSRVICLGPLPKNIRPPHQRPPPPRLVGSNGEDLVLSTIPSIRESRRVSTADTLGSNFTVEEEARGLGHTDALTAPDGPFDDEEPLSAHTASTVDGSDLVHIPLPTTPVIAAVATSRLDGRSDFVHVPTPVEQPMVPVAPPGRLNGFDLVHIPQPAQKRYSWEE
ncbi:aspartic peptidase domain-containing protein [Xylariales sp. PMI_506]|nr:aspartic peptidase domain-containing protein [Xylariales sp. PMI_506]